MKYRFLFLLVLLCSASTFGQKLVSEQTLSITKDEFNRKVIFNHEALFDFSGDLDKKVLSIIDADEFLQYVVSNARKLLYLSITDEQVEKFKVDFTAFFNSQFANKNTYRIERPSYDTAMEWRNALTDMNYAMFFVLRKEYYEHSIKQGKTKFQFTRDNAFAEQIHVKVYQSYNDETGKLKTTTVYILDKHEHQVFSHAKFTLIDKSKIALLNPNPIKWETRYEENGDGTIEIIVSAKIVKLWSIFGLKQPTGTDLVPTTVVRFNKSENCDMLGDVTETKVKPKYDKRYSSKINLHMKNVEFSQKLKLTNDKPVTISGNVFYMLSNVESLTPKSYDFEIEIK